MQRRMMACAVAALLSVAGAASALAAPTGDTTGSTAATHRDKVFLESAIRGDNSEIALGKLASEKGGTQGIKDFGQTLVTDHTQGKQDADSVADQAGVQKTDGMTAEARREERKLQRLSGRAFDREFTRYMIRDHKEDLAEFQRMAKHKTGGPIVDLAKNTVPVLQKHLQMAENLQKNPNGMGAMDTGPQPGTPNTAMPDQAAPKTMPMQTAPATTPTTPGGSRR